MPQEICSASLFKGWGPTKIQGDVFSSNMWELFSSFKIPQPVQVACQEGFPRNDSHPNTGFISHTASKCTRLVVASTIQFGCNIVGSKKGILGGKKGLLKSVYANWVCFCISGTLLLLSLYLHRRDYQYLRLCFSNNPWMYYLYVYIYISLSLSHYVHKAN